MEIWKIIREILKVRKVTQKSAAAMMGVTQPTFSVFMSKTPKGIEDRIALLDYLGYEVIVREKRAGRRAEGEYVVTAGEKEGSR